MLPVVESHAPAPQIAGAYFYVDTELHFYNVLYEMFCFSGESFSALQKYPHHNVINPNNVKNERKSILPTVDG